MSDSRKQPSVTWLYVALVILMPVAYCLSLGPLFGILYRMNPEPEWLSLVWDYYAAPAQFVYDSSPACVQDSLDTYMRWFIF